MKRIFKICVFISIGLLYTETMFGEKYKWEDEGGTKSTKSSKSLTSGCNTATASTFLELNNVRALIQTGGDMWWDLNQSPSYEIPKGSGQHSLFAGAIWIGGTDVNGQLRLAAVKYRAGGTDYWTGPLITTTAQRGNVTSDVCVQYDRHFVVSRDQVVEFRSWFLADEETRAQDFSNYSIPLIIEEWPAHGDIADGYDYHLAPFFDNDGDDAYDPAEGDYPFYDLEGNLPCGTSRKDRLPRLYGDQTLWWVYNDKGNIHTETGGAAIGMEIRAQAFAFATNDELNNMTFGNYEIINRSTYTLMDTYFGVWTDADLGNPEDDFVGCDVQKGLGYLYNGDEDDDVNGNNHYGKLPPAIGLDFFEGPYQDPDGLDNGSSYEMLNGVYTDVLKQPCDVNISNGNINGLNFGDGIVDNERWGMRRFIYFNREGGGNQGDPNTAVEYYGYLKGKWKDGVRMKYGGTGYGGTGPEADFMFPGSPTTDVCGWGTGGVPQLDWVEAGNTPGDRRFVQSAGPFTLEPGAVNDITVGAVWARAQVGYAWSSVEEVRRADDKAQKLFENCFKVVNGPDAPELDIIELDKELIFHIFNEKLSNNYLEEYHELDNSISCPVLNPSCDKYFNFQGYQVYQLKDFTVSVSDIQNVSLSRLVFQCDVKDGVGQLVNYYWSNDLNTNVPVEEVKGQDDGIAHSFVITDDAFASGDRRLVNFKKYYFLAIAYGYNNYETYDQLDPTALQGQKTPYKAGRKGASGAIKTYEVIPHMTTPAEGGTVLRSQFGDGLAITSVEGHGNGNNWLELSPESYSEIMSGSPWRATHPTYLPGYGPIQVKVVDPLNVMEDDFILRFDSATTNQNGFITNSKWFVYKRSEENVAITTKVPKTYTKIDLSYKDTIVQPFEIVKDFDIEKDDDGNIISVKFVDRKVYPESTIFSERRIYYKNEQLITEWGISIIIQQTDVPINQPYLTEPADGGLSYENNHIINNGLIGGFYEFADPRTPWLQAVIDDESCDPTNWIKSGSRREEAGGAKDAKCNDYLNSVFNGTNPVLADEFEAYENLMGGAMAPYFLASQDETGGDYKRHGVAMGSARGAIKTITQRLASVDIIITKNKALWTRCAVIETTEMDTSSTGVEEAGPSEGKVFKFDLRAAPSKDKNGNIDTTNGGIASSNPDSPNYIGPRGMSWFPGYAIDVGTGRRLNIVFGESSWLAKDNGRDMLWNPSDRDYTDLDELIWGGKHIVYIMGNNKDVGNVDFMPAYDAGQRIYDLMKDNTLLTYKNIEKKNMWLNAMWAFIPYLAPGYQMETYDDIPCDVTLKVRIANPYNKSIRDLMYSYDTSYFVTQLPTISSKDRFYYDIVFNPDSSISGFNIITMRTDSVSKNNNLPMYYFSTTGKAPIVQNNEVAVDALDLIRVVPNPYYGFNSYELSQLENLVKITNLPQKCTISIYTINGILIRRFIKDSDLPYQEWNLKNEYSVPISSGVYVIHIDAPGIGEKVLKWFGVLRPIDLSDF